MTRRERVWAVLAIVAGGAIAIISSTQTWMDVTLRAGATEPIPVPGAAAVTLLAPLSLAALALGLAMTVVGRALRYAFGGTAVFIGVALCVQALRVGFALPIDAIAATVTTTTGLTGNDAVAGLVISITATIWPYLTGIAGIVIALGGFLTLATGHRWASGGRRYQVTGGSAPASRPHDAIDSWDDLSRGDDPTSR
ncbi:Trp biosynthesis-associated membrane protein [uncultured Microbacterium sp.]|uniref:Trp biosynthesis-associated membrane protein n=1 Tax=uncultured Microbacterium sp. TaxID=191216 RepID=UPI0026222A38|nr:Trp biosynthesis-associated membrane protein [uncultured Microbacterium sp.]